MWKYLAGDIFFKITAIADDDSAVQRGGSRRRQVKVLRIPEVDLGLLAVNRS